VQATGRYDGAHEVLLRNQIRGDDAGSDLLTLLRLAGGSAVFVDRGWIAAGSSAPSPPAGEVVVRGSPASHDRSGPRTKVRAVDGRVSVSRVDLDRLGPLRRSVAPRVDPAQFQQPLSDGAPKLPQPPPPDRVNHLQYAIEWFGLAAIP